MYVKFSALIILHNIIMFLQLTICGLENITLHQQNVIWKSLKKILFFAFKSVSHTGLSKCLKL
jgi:hypothetical protein